MHTWQAMLENWVVIGLSYVDCRSEQVKGGSVLQAKLGYVDEPHTPQPGGVARFPKVSEMEYPYPSSYCFQRQQETEESTWCEWWQVAWFSYWCQRHSLEQAISPVSHMQNGDTCSVHITDLCEEQVALHLETCLFVSWVMWMGECCIHWQTLCGYAMVIVTATDWIT